MRISVLLVCLSILLSSLGSLAIGTPQSRAARIYVEEFGDTIDTRDFTFGEIINLMDEADEETWEALNQALQRADYKLPTVRLDEDQISFAESIFQFIPNDPEGAFEETRRTIDSATRGVRDRDVQRLMLEWWGEIRKLGPRYALEFKGAEVAYLSRFHLYRARVENDVMRRAFSNSLRYLAGKFAAAAKNPAEPNSYEEFGALCRELSALLKSEQNSEALAASTPATPEQEEFDEGSSTEEGTDEGDELKDDGGFRRPAPREKKRSREESGASSPHFNLP